LQQTIKNVILKSALRLAMPVAMVTQKYFTELVKRTTMLTSLKIG